MIRTVSRTRARIDWPVATILRLLGLKAGRYYAWLKRQWDDRLEDRSPTAHNPDELLADEVEAIKTYALAHPEEGCQRLAWMMVDEDVAYVSGSSVYRVLNAADLLYRWKRPDHETQNWLSRPVEPHERWHTDLMYLWVSGHWYFFVGVLDSYSRYIVHWELLMSMRAEETKDVIRRAKQRYPDASPQVVTDNGTQFVCREFRKLLKELSMEHIRIRRRHPESNGRIERFHRSLREGISEKDMGNYYQAVDTITDWVNYYNHERLHSALNYLSPYEYFAGDPDARMAERRAKLHDARRYRRRENLRRSGRPADTVEMPAWDACTGKSKDALDCPPQPPEMTEAELPDKTAQPLCSISGGVAGRLPAGENNTVTKECEQEL